MFVGSAERPGGDLVVSGWSAEGPGGLWGLQRLGGLWMVCSERVGDCPGRDGPRRRPQLQAVGVFEIGVLGGVQCLDQSLVTMLDVAGRAIASDGEGRECEI